MFFGVGEKGLRYSEVQKGEVLLKGRGGKNSTASALRRREKNRDPGRK